MDIKELDVLGCKVKLAQHTAADENSIDPLMVVQRYNKIAEIIKEAKPNLSLHELSVLTGLQVATELMQNEKSYNKSINEFKSDVNLALKFIEEINLRPKH